eukprot:CAMPEP_0172537542 /NCGR_PEP_ID=MMETSP1067-20121228/9128_1 /TAXON_ID=265564 ORGANISM="Thalassiosira punctigera, Strain Tpunct2005C2" /NCGR_SAMPLE_ID=MMETSP1067 /ASSEMBLY_ACC=CAM_ASM_000444 /LENGTH=68 /DNA_ID=CAMNT_0013322867 /DNA_START=32 /DNA_END=234 /DNA_ORIENTATION=+
MTNLSDSRTSSADMESLFRLPSKEIADRLTVMLEGGAAAVLPAEGLPFLPAFAAAAEERQDEVPVLPA